MNKVARYLLAALMAFTWPLTAAAQTYPSPTFQDITGLGTLSLTNVPLALASGGLGANNAAGGRSTLGLGTSATINTGTSGATIPLLNGTNSWSGQQTFTSTNLAHIYDSPAANTRGWQFNTSGSTRWIGGVTGGTESGGNASSNFFLNRYSDTGVFIDTPFLVTRSTGVVTLSQPLPVASGGSGTSTSTGTGALVRATSPTLVTPALGTPTALVLTNASGLPLSTGVTGTLPNANLASMAASTVKCNATGGAASPTDCTLGASLQFSGSALQVNPLLTLSNLTVNGATGTSATFIGSGTTSNIWLNEVAVASSATLPEIGGQFTISSNVGIANTNTAYKIGLTASALGGASSASVYGANIITQGHAGAGGVLVTGTESDVNNIGADAASLGGTTAAYSYVGVSAGSALSTAAYWAFGTGAPAGWHFGFASSGNISDAAFIDASSASTSFEGTNGMLVGTTSFARQSMMQAYTSGNTFTILSRLENNNGGSPSALMGFQVSATGPGETRAAKGGIGFTRTGAQGVGTLALYNRITGDTSDFTSTDAVLTFNGSGVLQFPKAVQWTANGAVATTMTSLGPTGSHTTVQEWFTVVDSAGTTRYIPAY